MGGYKTWAALEEVTAANMNTYVRDNTVPQFASAAARSAAIAAPVTGTLSFLTDTNALDYYSGSAWVTIAGGGAWTSWTPTFYQNGARTITNTYSRYVQRGKTIHATANFTVTNAGTAGQAIAISAPVSPATNTGVVGGWQYSRAATFEYVGNTVWNGSTFYLSRDGGVLGATPSIATANGDVVKVSFTYEAA